MDFDSIGLTKSQLEDVVREELENYWDEPLIIDFMEDYEVLRLVLQKNSDSLNIKKSGLKKGMNVIGSDLFHKIEVLYVAEVNKPRYFNAEMLKPKQGQAELMDFPETHDILLKMLLPYVEYEMENKMMSKVETNKIEQVKSNIESDDYNVMGLPVPSSTDRFKGVKLNLTKMDWVDEIFKDVPKNKGEVHIQVLRTHFGTKDITKMMDEVFDSVYHSTMSENRNTLLMAELDNLINCEKVPMDRLLHIIFYSDMNAKNLDRETNLMYLLHQVNNVPYLCRYPSAIEAIYARSDLSLLDNYGVSILDKTIDLYKKDVIDLSPRCWDLLISKSDIANLAPSRLKVLKEIVELINFDTANYPQLQSKPSEALKSITESLEELKSKVGSNMFVKANKPVAD